MTTVTYDPWDYSMTAEGHAFYTEEGIDIVCAGVCALVQTLPLALKNADIIVTETIIEDEKPKHIVKAHPKMGSAVTCRTIFDTIFAGISGLEIDFPENVHAVIVERNEEE